MGHLQFLYRSPLRPLDMGFACRAAREHNGVPIEVDWDATTIGPFDPATMATRIYAFTAPLPTSLVESLQLEWAS